MNKLKKIGLYLLFFAIGNFFTTPAQGSAQLTPENIKRLMTVNNEESLRAYIAEFMPDQTMSTTTANAVQALQQAYRAAQQGNQALANQAVLTAEKNIQIGRGATGVTRRETSPVAVSEPSMLPQNIAPIVEAIKEEVKIVQALAPEERQARQAAQEREITQTKIEEASLLPQQQATAPTPQVTEFPVRTVSSAPRVVSTTPTIDPSLQAKLQAERVQAARAQQREARRLEAQRIERERQALLKKQEAENLAAALRLADEEKIKLNEKTRKELAAIDEAGRREQAAQESAKTDLATLLARARLLNLSNDAKFKEVEAALAGSNQENSYLWAIGKVSYYGALKKSKAFTPEEEAKWNEPLARAEKIVTSFYNVVIENLEESIKKAPVAQPAPTPAPQPMPAPQPQETEAQKEARFKAEARARNDAIVEAEKQKQEAAALTARQAAQEVLQKAQAGLQEILNQAKALGLNQGEDFKRVQEAVKHPNKSGSYIWAKKEAELAESMMRSQAFPKENTNFAQRITQMQNIINPFEQAVIRTLETSIEEADAAQKAKTRPAGPLLITHVPATISTLPPVPAEPVQPKMMGKPKTPAAPAVVAKPKTPTPKKTAAQEKEIKLRQELNNLIQTYTSLNLDDPAKKQARIDEFNDGKDNYINNMKLYYLMLAQTPPPDKRAKYDAKLKNVESIMKTFRDTVLNPMQETINTEKKTKEKITSQTEIALLDAYKKAEQEALKAKNKEIEKLTTHAKEFNKLNVDIKNAVYAKILNELSDAKTGRAPAGSHIRMVEEHAAAEYLQEKGKFKSQEDLLKASAALKKKDAIDKFRGEMHQLLANEQTNKLKSRELEDLIIKFTNLGLNNSKEGKALVDKFNSGRSNYQTALKRRSNLQQEPPSTANTAELQQLTQTIDKFDEEVLDLMRIAIQKKSPTPQPVPPAPPAAAPKPVPAPAKKLSTAEIQKILKEANKEATKAETAALALLESMQKELIAAKFKNDNPDVMKINQEIAATKVKEGKNISEKSYVGAKGLLALYEHLIKNNVPESDENIKKEINNLKPTVESVVKETELDFQQIRRRLDAAPQPPAPGPVAQPQPAVSAKEIAALQEADKVAQDAQKEEIDRLTGLLNQAQQLNLFMDQFQNVQDAIDYQVANGYMDLVKQAARYVFIMRSPDISPATKNKYQNEWKEKEGVFVQNFQREHVAPLEEAIKIETQRLAALPAGPVAAANDTFSILSVNELSDDFYKKHFKDKGQENSRVRLDIRQQTFNQIVGNLKPDILALQEYDLDYSPVPNFGDYEFITDGGVSVRPGNRLFLGLKKDRFEPITAPLLFQPFTTPGAAGSGWVGLVAKVKGGNQDIGIINTHLRGGVPQGFKDKSEFAEAQLGEIFTFINTKGKGVPHWIICGDFNWELNAPGSRAAQFIQSKGFAINDTQNTALNSNGKYVKMDYIISKGLVQDPKPNEHISVEPKQNELLTHKATDRNKTYFSDHATLFTRFKIPAPAAP